MKTFCLVFALACLLMAPMILAQEDTAQKQPERRGIEPHPKVTTTVIFPQSESKQFLIGKPVDVVIGFSNDADVALNVTVIGAQLIYPYDWRVVIQNFTRLFPFQIVQPGEKASFYYMFFPDPMLEPREYGLTGRIAYQTVGGANNYTSTYHNSTIVLFEVSEPLDAQALFTWVAILGFIGVGGFMVYRQMTQKKKRSSRVETGTKVVYDDDWLEGTSAKKSKKGQQQQQNKPKKN